MRSHLTNGRYLIFSFFIYILAFHSVLSQDDELDNDYESSISEEQSQKMGSVRKSSYRSLQPPECGNSPHNNAQVNVIGGRPAALGAWPWIAVIGFEKGGNPFGCGGALISSRHIVTAGHCINHIQDLPLYVRLGELNLKSDNDGAHPIDIHVEKAILHPDFNEDTLENDIAILRLSRDVPFTDAIHPICLPISDDLRNRDFVGTNLFVAGWGSTSNEGSTSNILLEAQIPVVSNEQCKKAYENVNSAVIDDRVLCAGYAQGGKDACQGDSGDPFMFPVKQTFYLIGIVSGGYRCAEPGFPGFYTRVTRFLDFIESNLN